MSQESTNPAIKFYQAWADKTPFATRTIVMGIVIEYILSFLLPFESFLGNETRYTVFKFEIYRLLFSPMVGNSLITMILILMTFPTMGSRLEFSMGSASYLSLLGTLSIATNLIFSTVCIIMYALGTSYALYWKCNGFWTILFSLITIDCLQTPDAPKRMMFIPVDIPSKYFPLAMYGLFCLFSGLQLSFAIAILVGYLQSKSHLDRFRPAYAVLEELEAADGSLHGTAQSKGWVPAGAGAGREEWIPINTAEATWANSSAPQEPSSAMESGSAHGHTHAQPKEMFPGTGHRLDSGAGRQPSNMMSFSSHGATSSSSSHGSGVGLSREEMAARRLAALSQNAAANGNVPLI